MKNKIFISLLPLIIWAITIRCQNPDSITTRNIINAMEKVLQTEGIIHYGCEMRFKSFGEEYFDTRKFLITYRLDKDNSLYGYNYEISEKLINGNIFTFMALNHSFFMLYDSTWDLNNNNKEIFESQLPDQIEIGNYFESMRMDLILSEVFAPFTNISSNEIAVVDSNNFYYLNRKINNLASRQLILDKKTFLPTKYISKIKADNFDMFQTLEVLFDFNQKIPESALSPSYYFSLGYRHTYKETTTEINEKSIFTLSQENQNIIFNYPFLFSNNDTCMLKELPGKYIIVDFWYSSCLPCLKALPKLDTLSTFYKQLGLQVVGINCYDQSKKIYLESKLRLKNINIPLIYGSEDLLKKLNISSFPTYCLIMPDHTVNLIYGGIDEVQAILKSIFEK